MRVLVLLTAIAAACASAPPPPPRAVPVPSDLPRSSIAAVLLHRDELGLTPAQVDAMLRRDDALAREDQALRTRLASGSSARSGASEPSPAGGGRGGRRGGRRPSSPAHPADPVTQLDDNDTRAYLDIEEQVLTDRQRPRAREIASGYREELYDRQHPAAARSHGSPDAGG